MDTSSDVLKAFRNLGRGVELSSPETVAALEKFICQLYCPKGSDIVKIPQVDGTYSLKNTLREKNYHQHW